MNNDRAPSLMTFAEIIVDPRLLADFVDDDCGAESFGLLSCSDGDMQRLLKLLLADFEVVDLQ